MIQITIRERAEKQNINSSYQLQKALEISSPDVASRLWSNDFSRIDLSTLDRLCRVLKCQPNALFRYVTDNEIE